MAWSCVPRASHVSNGILSTVNLHSICLWIVDQKFLYFWRKVSIHEIGGFTPSAYDIKDYDVTEWILMKPIESSRNLFS